MYSERIVQQSIERIERDSRERGTPLTLHRFSVADSIEMTAEIVATRNRDGEQITPLTLTQRQFIANEITICAIDFNYFSERYCFVLGGDDNPGLQRLSLWGSQKILMRKVAQLEEVMWDAIDNNLPVDGICMVWHKARQLGASAVAQALLTHRANFHKSTRCLTASMDEDAVKVLHRRADRILNNLPFFLQSAIKTSSMERGVIWEPAPHGMDSVIELQHFKQSKGVGQGEQWDVSHLTECSQAQDPTKLYDLFASIPRSRSALSIWESTSQLMSGDGNIGRWWKDFTEQIRSGTAEGGAGRFGYVFIPFYAADVDELDPIRKHQSNPPIDWTPNEKTILFARKVEESSPEWMDGRTITLPREILYWYETSRQQAYLDGRLNKFLVEHCATPEESFQHAAGGVFTTETIEELHLTASATFPLPYRITSSSEEAQESQLGESPTHRTLTVMERFLIPMQESELQRYIGKGTRQRRIDPRGVVWLWEEPRRDCTYVVGVDPSGGIPGWDRYYAATNDLLSDNGVVSVWRKESRATRCDTCGGSGKVARDSGSVINSASFRAGITSRPCDACLGRGKIGGRAIQVAEYAAPIPPEDLALYAAALGRLYSGDSAYEEALMIVESNNHGPVTINEVQNTFGYANLYFTTDISTGLAKPLKRIGWNSGPTTVPVLHARSRRIVVKGDALIRSRWMVQELADAVEISVMTPAGPRTRFHVPPGAGRHDDRMSAAFFALWALFGWNEVDDLTSASSDTRNPPAALPEYAARAVTAGTQQEKWNEAIGEIVAEIDLAAFDEYLEEREGFFDTEWDAAADPEW